MEASLSGIQMRTPKLLLAVVLGILALFTLVFHQTFYGLLSQRLPWKEDAFVGKPLAELEKELGAEDHDLHPADQSTFFLMTRRDLSPNQKLVYFVKGKKYSWFFFGTAVNIGYVVVERDHGERVVEILHGRSVDSL